MCCDFLGLFQTGGKILSRQNFRPGCGLKFVPDGLIDLVVEAASDNRYDTRFDFDFATRLLLDIAQERSLERLLEKSVSAPNPEIARSEIWLIEKGDICSCCPQRPLCPDQTRCPHMVAGRGKSIPASGKRQRPFEDPDSRVTLGVGPMGEAGAAREPKSVPHADKQPSSLPGLEWRREEGVREYRIAADSVQRRAVRWLLINAVPPGREGISL